MHFSMPLFAAAALASAAPAEAALWLVTGTGEGRVTWCSSVGNHPCGAVLAVNFDFVVDDAFEGGIPGSPSGYITREGLWLRLTDQYHYFFGRKMIVEGDAGTDKPQGTGWISYTSQERYAHLAGEGPVQLSAVRYMGPRRANDFSMSVAAVPEPATWLAMILGFGVVGASLRKRASAHVAPNALEPQATANQG